jgi:hypothetical protein
MEVVTGIPAVRRRYRPRGRRPSGLVDVIVPAAEIVASPVRHAEDLLRAAAT